MRSHCRPTPSRRADPVIRISKTERELAKARQEIEALKKAAY
jgi:hypothetical protein